MQTHFLFFCPRSFALETRPAALPDSVLMMPVTSRRAGHHMAIYLSYSGINV